MVGVGFLHLGQLRSPPGSFDILKRTVDVYGVGFSVQGRENWPWRWGVGGVLVHEGIPGRRTLRNQSQVAARLRD